MASSTTAALWQRNLDLVKSISPRQRVEVDTALQVDCQLDPALPSKAELAWVKVERGGWETLLSYYTPSEGVENLFPGITGTLDQKTWQLTFQRVNRTDTGFYQCQVLLGDEPVSTRKVMISVLDPSKVSHKTQYVIKKAGGNVTLDCTDFTGEQEAAWRKIGEGSQVQSAGKKLRLLKVDREDSGVYVCQVSGGRTALNVSLRVDHAPTLNVSKTVFQAPGFPTSLHCQVAAVPVPAVAWIRNGERVTSDGTYAISISDYRDGWLTLSLLIPSVSRSQYGNYTCEATNDYGEERDVSSLLYSDVPILPASGKAEGQHTSLLRILSILFCCQTLIHILRA